MKKTYAVKKVRLADLTGKNLKEYNDAIKRARTQYITGFENVCDYLGARPIRQRCGYSGIVNGFEYVITEA